AHEAQATANAPADVAQATSKSGNFFSAEGPSFHDVLDAINPLNQIPIVSDLFASATDHTPSTASKLAGGALLGGPIGFVANLAEVIFESAKGVTPAQSVYAALAGNDDTQVAANEAVEPADQITVRDNMPEQPSAVASVAPPTLPPSL